jgi:hypothetical protein
MGSSWTFVDFDFLTSVSYDFHMQKTLPVCHLLAIALMLVVCVAAVSPPDPLGCSLISGGAAPSSAYCPEQSCACDIDGDGDLGFCSPAEITYSGTVSHYCECSDKTMCTGVVVEHLGTGTWHYIGTCLNNCDCYPDGTTCLATGPRPLPAGQPFCDCVR